MMVIQEQHEKHIPVLAQQCSVGLARLAHAASEAHETDRTGGDP